MNWRVLALLVLLWSGAACHRKVAAVAPAVAPPPVVLIPAALREGDSAFDNGEFARAARSFESYLESDPKSDDIDRILFRFAIAESMSGVTARVSASSDDFNRLIHDFPKSEYVPAARMILSLGENMDKLHSENAQLKADSIRVQAMADNAKAAADNAQSAAENAQAVVARLQVDVKTRDEKIKQLMDELDKLKKIDTERRRTP